jgi:hypothetical protein
LFARSQALAASYTKTSFSPAAMRGSVRYDERIAFVRTIFMRRLIAIIFLLVGVLNLQGCATSSETFALGGLLGFLAGAGAVTCAVTCD